MLFTAVDNFSEQGSPTNFQTWDIPQCPFLIACSFEVLEQIRRTVETASDFRREEREAGGVLFGIYKPGRISILAAKPLPCEYAMGPGFVLSENDEKALARLTSSPTSDPKLSGLQALGWYHSHLRSKIFLSPRDREIHSRHFGAPYQIALVVHPRSGGALRAGFFFQEASGAIRTESSYEEFTIAAPAPAAPEPTRETIPKQDKSGRQKRPEKPEPLRTEAACPRCGSEQLRRSRRAGPIDQLRGVLGYNPYRCNECLSRSFLKTSSPLMELARSNRHRRPEERKRAWQRTRREIILWGCGIFGFLAILYYLIRDTGPKQDQP
jgi:proteasome lid subunit RPN8/RPN11/DNA-directed RNA polymerase subunit RPC12/RpoP